MIVNHFDQFVGKILKESPDNIRVNGKYIEYSDVFGNDAHTGLLMAHDPTRFIISKSDLTNSKKLSLKPGHANFVEAISEGRFAEMRPYVVTNLSPKVLEHLDRSHSLEMVQTADRIRVFRTTPNYISIWGTLSEKKFIGMKKACSAIKVDLDALRWDVSVFIDAFDQSEEVSNMLEEITPKKIYPERDVENSYPYYTTKQLEEFFTKTQNIPDIIAKFEAEERRKKEEQNTIERNLRLRAAGFQGRKKNYWEQ